MIRLLGHLLKEMIHSRSRGSLIRLCTLPQIRVFTGVKLLNSTYLQRMLIFLDFRLLLISMFQRTQSLGLINQQLHEGG